MGPSFYWTDEDVVELEPVAAGPAIELRPIGHVANQGATRGVAEAAREGEARIVLDPSYAEGLQGLEADQRLMVVFALHCAGACELLQHPRGDRSRPRRGVFSLRSPRRPNPIGVTVVEIVEVVGNVIRVRGLDALEGSPVLDLKPALTVEEC